MHDISVVDLQVGLLEAINYDQLLSLWMPSSAIYMPELYFPSVAYSYVIREVIIIEVMGLNYSCPL